MDTKYAHHIAAELNLSVKQISSIHQLHAEGSSIPFIARYRKEATGNLDEVVIANVIDQVKYFNELEKRKETVFSPLSVFRFDLRRRLCLRPAAQSSSKELAKK